MFLPSLYGRDITLKLFKVGEQRLARDFIRCLPDAGGDIGEVAFQLW
jgi:hypothetical protein